MSQKVAKKIIEVMSKVSYLKKDGNVNFKSTNYNYLSEEKVTTAISKARIEIGLVILPIKTEVIDNSESRRTIVVTYAMIDADSGESIEVQMPGEGSDTKDKGISKALTQAFKYLQRQSFGIATGDDPDHVSNGELEKQQKEQAEREAVRIEQERQKLVTECKDTYKLLKGDMDGYDELIERLKKEGRNEREILSFLKVKQQERSAS